jgi:ABC-2 type transport system permease protein
MRVILNLMRQDLATALRDNIVLYMIISPLLLALLVRLFLPSVEAAGLSVALSRDVDSDLAATLEDYAVVELFATDDEVISRVEQNDAVPGLIIDDGELVLLFEGNEPEAIIKAGQAVLTAVTAPERLVEFEAQSIGESASLFREILILSLIMLALLLGGVASGFNIIDEKDSKAVNALAVTPLGLRRYIAARALGAAAVAFLVTSGTALILVGSAINYLLLTAAIASSILIITAITLTVGGFANNQVSAIAVIKVMMPVYLALPIVSLFVPGRWQAIFYPLPNYWQFRMLKSLFFGAEVTGQFWLSMLLAFLLSGIFLIILLKITGRRLMPSGGE